MVVVGSAQGFISIVARLRKEAGDFDGGSNGDDAGVGGEVARWLLGGALVGASMGLLVGALVGQRLGREQHRDVGQAIGRRQRGSIGQRQRWSICRGLERR